MEGEVRMSIPRFTCVMVNSTCLLSELCPGINEFLRLPLDVSLMLILEIGLSQILGTVMTLLNFLQAHKTKRNLL